MAARPYWKGQLWLALVSINVEIYSATTSGTKLIFSRICQSLPITVLYFHGRASVTVPPLRLLQPNR